MGQERKVPSHANLLIAFHFLRNRPDGNDCGDVPIHGQPACPLRMVNTSPCLDFHRPITGMSLAIPATFERRVDFRSGNRLDTFHAAMTVEGSRISVISLPN